MVKKKKKSDEFERSIENYFKEIGCTVPLSRDEEYELWWRYKFNNDISARNRIVTSNLKFVASIARGYQGRGLSYSDLIAEGNVGLIKALDRFDGNRGNKVISYSVWWIRQTILEALEKRSLIDADDMPGDFEKQKPANDDDDDDDEVGPTDNTCIVDEREKPSSSDIVIDMVDIVTNLTTCLNNREKMIISEYYGLNGREEKTLEEIGAELGLTKERVRQINEKSLKKMRSEIMGKFVDVDLLRSDYLLT